MERNEVFSLFYLLLILWPLLIMMWKGQGEKRFIKHIVIWGMLIVLGLLLFKLIVPPDAHRQEEPVLRLKTQSTGIDHS